ncbi:hypothetical protein ESCO_005356 [Escovopsis weberi]|uniref:Uncharacterized protein n=1 Tax=Escovopsis weberi TaxID=150374 RepID=A0A0N0RTP8_ESCWE|nr:hypothetical protein ESCO_005356 [Escovopsis weberi]
MQFYSDELERVVRAKGNKGRPTNETSTSTTAAAANVDRNRVSRSTIRARRYNNPQETSSRVSTKPRARPQPRAAPQPTRPQTAASQTGTSQSRPQSRLQTRPPSRQSLKSAYRTRPTHESSAVSMPRSRVSTKTATTATRPRYQEPDTQSYLSESIYTSLSRASSRDTWEQGNWEEEDLPPAVLYNTAYSTASVATYDSALSDEEETHVNYGFQSDANSSTSSCSAGNPPAVLPPYQCAPMSETASVRSSDPDSFAHLFPSMARLSIRHDERTADGNMNLRVDTIVPDPSSRRRRPIAIQLFHLRMHDLARRDFSLRRYCRDSGREVCNSKGATPRNPNDPRPGFQQSVTTAIRSMKTSFRRSTNSGGGSPVAGGSPDPRRPSLNSNGSWKCLSAADAADENADDATKLPAQRPIPANTIKLEFSNYARVEIVRHRHKAYEFEWWGHRYAWRRVVDKGCLGKIAYHLIRDNQGPPVAVIVPEGRSPTQIEADNNAGSWIPPCHMWINDRSIIEVMTDIADVVVATGLMALVDDCIRQRWPAKRPKTAVAAAGVQQAPASSRPVSQHAPVADPARPKTFMHSLFQRQHRMPSQHAYGPLRIRNAVTVY